MNNPFSNPIQAILFDLDGTLFAEREYVYGAYDSVAQWVSDAFSVQREAFLHALIARWEVHGSRYPHIFEEALHEFGIALDENVSAMVKRYNAYAPSQLSPFPGTIETLELLGKHVKVGLVTDGAPQRQRRKVEALGIADYFLTQVYTGDWGVAFFKPHPRGYETALRQLRVQSDATIFVGDSPKIDLAGAKTLGMGTILMHDPASVMAFDHADASVSDLREIPAMLGFATNSWAFFGER